MKLNALTIVGIVLVALGVLGLLGVGIPGQETLSVGDLSATVETKRTVSPIVAGALLVGGLVAMAMGHKKP
jgi:hypothetical protein